MRVVHIALSAAGKPVTSENAKEALASMASEDPLLQDLFNPFLRPLITQPEMSDKQRKKIVRHVVQQMMAEQGDEIIMKRQADLEAKQAAAAKPAAPAPAPAPAPAAAGATPAAPAPAAAAPAAPAERVKRVPLENPKATMKERYGLTFFNASRIAPDTAIRSSLFAASSHLIVLLLLLLFSLRGLDGHCSPGSHSGSSVDVAVHCARRDPRSCVRP